MNPTLNASQLIRDLWSFIENVTDDDPERTDKFFVLRQRVREFYLFKHDLDQVEQGRPSNSRSPL